MKYTEEQIKAIEDYSQLLFTPGEIALLIEVDKTELINDIKLKNNKAYKAFSKGKFSAEIILRKSIIELAEAGSSPAQNLLLKLKEESELKTINENG